MLLHRQLGATLPQRVATLLDNPSGGDVQVDQTAGIAIRHLARYSSPWE